MNLSFLNSTKARLAAVFTSGASTALAFAPYQFWPVYILALAFTLIITSNLSSRSAFTHWLTFGFGSFAFGISWVHVSMAKFGGLPILVTILLMGVLALYLALFPAIAGYLFSRLAPRAKAVHYLLLFPSLWTLAEWFRGWVLTGFPWLWAGYSQTNGPLAPLASVIGALGISFVIASLAGVLLLVYKRRAWLASIVTTATICICTLAAPSTSSVKVTGETIKLALVQGNIPQSMKWEPDALWPTMLKYMDLTRENMGADIFIWPEAAVPAPDYLVRDYLDNVNQVANLNDSAIITGIISHSQEDFYNSLIVLGNKKAQQQSEASYQVPATPGADSPLDNAYLKHHLLPIGEFVPLEDILRPIAPLFNLPMSSFARGDYQQQNLLAAGRKVAPAICYEIAFPEQLRVNVHADTDLLLTVSNDAWFGASNGPLQHMEIAQMRAIEFGRPLVRATNNGVTAIVNAKGDIVGKLPQFETGVLVKEVELVSGQTIFNRWGQWPIILFSICFILIILCMNFKPGWRQASAKLSKPESH